MFIQEHNELGELKHYQHLIDISTVSEFII